MINYETKRDLGLKKQLSMGTELVEVGMMVQGYHHGHHLTQSQLAYKVHMF